MPALATTTCPSCGSRAEGRFCASCGAPLEGATCRTCASSLTPAARFCHHCGAPVGTTGSHPSEQRGSTALPWVVASIALVALVALVAAQRFSAPTGTRLDAPINALPQAQLGEVPANEIMDRAPDISQLTPRERADRLFDRVMRLHERGRTDSVQFFAQMA